MSFAIIETGGKQYKVRQGDTLVTEKLEKEAGDTVKFDRVLLVAPEQGEDTEVQLGDPYLNDVTVAGKVVEHGKGDKVVVFKKKPKKRYEKKQGHRQPYTSIQVTEIKA